MLSAASKIFMSGAQPVTVPHSQAGSINCSHLLNMSSGFRKTWIRVLVLALSSCVALGKALDLSEPL